MPLVSRASDGAIEMAAALRKHQGMRSGCFAGFLLRQDRFEKLAQQATHRSSVLGGEDFGLADQLPIQAERDVLRER